MKENKFEFTYFTVYLRSCLRKMGDVRADDPEFVNSRGREAAAEYETRRKEGYSVDQAEESAMACLIREL